jgi:hypothetical protein
MSGNNRKVKKICSSAIFVFPVHLFLNAGQFQSGTLFDIVFEWSRRVIAKIGLNKCCIPHKSDCWEEAIHRRTDWNFASCKFR